MIREERDKTETKSRTKSKSKTKGQENLSAQRYVRRNRVPAPAGKEVRSSKKEHKVDALALRADERRDKLR